MADTRVVVEVVRAASELPPPPPAPTPVFIWLSVTFEKTAESDIVFTQVAPVDGVNSDPDFSHMFLFTPGGFSIKSASAKIDEDVDKFNLSHVCAGSTIVDETGGLTVTKSVVGDAGSSKFTITVDCNDGTDHDGTIGFGSTGTLITSGTGVGSITVLPIIGIPVGTSCSVTESVNGGAIDTVITGSPAVIVALTVSEVTVENVFNEVAGDITVTLNVDKVLIGNINPQEGTTFTVHVSCVGDATVEKDLTFTYSSGLGVQSISEQIPTLGELTCTVTETNTGGTILEGYKIDGGSIQDGAPVVVLDLDRSSASVTVVNDPGSVGGSSATLPSTGSDTATLIKLAALLLVVGAAALLLTRRWRRATLLG